MPRHSFALATDAVHSPPSSPGDDFENDTLSPPLPPSTPRSSRLFAVSNRRPAASGSGLPTVLDSAQKATLSAIIAASSAPAGSRSAHFEEMPHNSPSLHLALNEFDTLCRIRTGSPFTELSSELQKAVLSLISTRDLTTPDFDLAPWLADLRFNLRTAAR